MDIDSEYRDAMRRLSVVDTTDEGMTRRTMLKAALATAGAAAAATTFGAGRADAAEGDDGTVAGSPPDAALPPPYATAAPPAPLAALPAAAAGAPVSQLLLIQLGGGNDGLNTLVPISGALGTNYRRMRGEVQITDPVRLNKPGTTTFTGFGLHPSMPFLANLFSQGKLGIVRGVGYPNSSLSHFDAIATWMAGTAVAGVPTSGWIGRWLDSVATPRPFDAIQIGSAVPLHMIGNTRKATAAPEWEPWFGVNTDPTEQLMYSALTNFSTTANSRGGLAQRLAGATNTMMTLNRSINPLYQTPTVLPEGGLDRKTTLAARIFNAGIGTRVISMVHGDYDQHDEQLGTHATRLGELDAAISAFFATLDPAAAGRTLVVTFSEFGRKPWANGSRGSDHGTASVMLVAGNQASGGLIGAAPSLTGLETWQDPTPTVDFRRVYSTLVGRWLGANATTILGGAYPQLAVLKGGPILA